MALIDFPHEPSDRDLRWFGLLVLVFLSFVAGVIVWRTDATTFPSVLVGIGVVFALVYYTLRPFQRPLYAGWMRLFYPLGWLMSHVVLGTIYFLVMTPMGFLMRLVGHDPMQRTLERDAPSYWIEKGPRRELSSYFKQF